MRPALTPQRIVACALELTDAQGLDALSMRRVAAKLGVTAMSLYNHVANKEALLGLMLDQVLKTIPVAAPDAEWSAALRLRAQSWRDALMAHPWAAVPMIARTDLSAAQMRESEAILGVLIRAGFSYAQADWARNAVETHVFGFVLLTQNYPVAPGECRAAAQQYLPMIPADYPHLRAAAQAVASGAYDGVLSFDYGLDLLIDGIRRARA